jgi:hypothetical protein
MALHGVTYFFRLSCGNIAVMSAVLTGSWHIFMGARSVIWTRIVAWALLRNWTTKCLCQHSAHVNDIRLQPLYTWQLKIWVLHALTRYTKFAVIYKKNDHIMGTIKPVRYLTGHHNIECDTIRLLCHAYCGMMQWINN